MCQSNLGVNTTKHNAKIPQAPSPRIRLTNVVLHTNAGLLGASAPSEAHSHIRWLIPKDTSR